MKKILLIEVEPAMSIAIPFFLEKENFEITLVSDEKLGYEKGRSEHFDLIILPFSLYNMNDGFDYCCDLRKDGITTPILLYGDIIEKRRFMKKEIDLEFGATDYIYRPFNRIKFLEKIKTLLG